MVRFAYILAHGSKISKKFGEEACVPRIPLSTATWLPNLSLPILPFRDRVQNSVEFPI